MSRATANILVPAAALVFLLALSAPVRAYLGTSFQFLQDMPHRYRWNATTDCMAMVQPSWQMASDFTKSKGGFGLVRTTGTFWYDIFSLQYENQQFYWHDVEDLPLGDKEHDPWDSLQTISLGANFLDTWVENFNFKAGGTLNSSFESSMDDSYGGTLWGQVKASFFDGWLLPLAWIKYTGIHPESAFMIGHLDLGLNIEVPGPRFVQFMAKEGWIDKDSPSDFNMDLMFYSRTRFYRLSNTSKVMARGYLETQELTVSVILSYKPTKQWEIRLMPEYLFNRNYHTYDHAGGRGMKYNINDTFGLTLAVGFNF